MEVDIVESKFRAAWRNPLSDLSLLNAPLFAEWEFEGLQWGGRSAGQPKAHKLRNQVKKKTTTANIWNLNELSLMGFEDPSGGKKANEKDCHGQSAATRDKIR